MRVGLWFGESGFPIVRSHLPFLSPLEQIGELLVVGQGVDDDALRVVEFAGHEGAQISVKVKLWHQCLWKVGNS